MNPIEINLLNFKINPRPLTPSEVADLEKAKHRAIEATKEKWCECGRLFLAQRNIWCPTCVKERNAQQKVRWNEAHPGRMTELQQIHRERRRNAQKI